MMEIENWIVRIAFAALFLQGKLRFRKIFTGETKADDVSDVLDDIIITAAIRATTGNH